MLIKIVYENAKCESCFWVFNSECFSVCVSVNVFLRCNSNLLLVDWHDQVNNIAVKFNRANALVLKIRNYVNTETLRNIYFAIFDSHLSCKLRMYYLGSKY